MLRLERISKYYFTGSQVVQALRRISFSVEAGELVCITGVSGSGKSTLLNIIGGLDTYEEGVLTVDGKDFSRYTVDEMEQYRKEQIGFVFQDFQIIDHYTVYQNVAVALSVFDLSKEEKHRRVMGLLDRVGLTDVAKRRASTLSGGEKQRTVIARTLAKDTPIIVCDEPTGNLNEEAGRGIFELLSGIAKERLVVVVTHDLRMVDDYATRKIRLHDGEIVEDQILRPRTIPLETEKRYVPKRTRLSQTIKIAWTNLTTLPKLTLFTWLATMIMLIGVLLTYGIGVVERNKAVDNENPYFVNATPTRIVLTNVDGRPFSTEDRSLIESLPNVMGFLDTDVLFDSLFLYKTIHPETHVIEFLVFEPLSALALENSDLLAGRLPQTAFEVVVGEDTGIPIDEEIEIANAYQLPPTDLLQTDQYSFVVVGIAREAEDFDSVHSLYLGEQGWERLALSSLQERAEVELRVEGTRIFDMSNDEWIVEVDVESKRQDYVLTVPIWITDDPQLDDDEIWVYDMVFYDICRDFGYKKEVRDDMEAGLCDAELFLASHQLSLRVNTMFSQDITFSPVVLRSTPQTDDDRSFKFYMNEATFRRFFASEPYQSSVLVRNAFYGKKVGAELIDLGYDVMIPAQVLSEEASLTVLIRNVVVTIITAAIVAALLSVGWVVLKNVAQAKRQDYLILRSLGMERSGMRRILAFEWAFVLLIAGAILTFAIVISKPSVGYLRLLLDHLRMLDYALIALIFTLFLYALSRRFSQSIFQTSVMKALKGVSR